ncbi:hypothetical protein NDU88_009204 [Pleurodeles waltl]|uniref:Uncharacterized protein n=1 Tax=Pleurodeles waltl TaxID=8319 RepID=A0AAV7P086_PLEWA|nr:hypothetical protein NDU88_009204 [Pleurodeles waltl]
MTQRLPRTRVLARIDTSLSCGEQKRRTPTRPEKEKRHTASLADQRSVFKLGGRPPRGASGDPRRGARPWPKEALYR